MRLELLEEHGVDASFNRRLDVLLVARVCLLTRHLQKAVARKVGLMHDVLADLLSVRGGVLWLGETRDR